MPFDYTGEDIIAKVARYMSSAIVSIADADSITAAAHKDTQLLVLVDKPCVPAWNVC